MAKQKTEVSEENILLQAVYGKIIGELSVAENSRNPDHVVVTLTHEEASAAIDFLGDEVLG
jgi:hypothetical protein